MLLVTHKEFKDYFGFPRSNTVINMLHRTFNVSVNHPVKDPKDKVRIINHGYQTRVLDLDTAIATMEEHIKQPFIHFTTKQRIPTRVNLWKSTLKELRKMRTKLAKELKHEG